MSVDLDDPDFQFIAIDLTDDQLTIKRQGDITTISTQRNGATKPGAMVALYNDDMRALRDWLNREFPE